MRKELFFEALGRGAQPLEAALEAGYRPRMAAYTAKRLMAEAESAAVKGSGERTGEKDRDEPPKERVKQQVMEELGSIAFSSIEDGQVKVSEKLKALELMGKSMNLFAEEQRQEGGIEVVFALPRPREDGDAED